MPDQSQFAGWLETAKHGDRIFITLGRSNFSPETLLAHSLGEDSPTPLPLQAKLALGNIARHVDYPRPFARTVILTMGPHFNIPWFKQNCCGIYEFYSAERI